ncbi:hypothetical protein NGRA_3560, partial [Nosema granulosis]
MFKFEIIFIIHFLITPMSEIKQHLTTEKQDESNEPSFFTFKKYFYKTLKVLETIFLGNTSQEHSQARQPKLMDSEIMMIVDTVVRSLEKRKSVVLDDAT